MESNIINIATLTIDRKEANDSIVKTKQQIFELQKANAELRKDILKNGDATGEQTKKFVENEAELKQLTDSYKKQQTAVNDLTLAQIKENKALTENAKSIEQATIQNKELLAIRNQVDASTKEGAQAIELLNDKMNSNTKFIKDNGNEVEKASHITGNYRQKIFELGEGFASNIPAVQQARTVVAGFGQILGQSANVVTDFTNKTIQGTKTTLGFKTSSQLATESINSQTVATEAQATAQGTLSVATNTTSKSFKVLKMAIVGTGIGALAILFLSLATALKQSEESGNKLGRVFSGFKGVTNSLLTALKPLGDILINGISKAFTTVGNTAEKALGLVAKGLKFLGLNDASKAVNDFSENTKKAVKASQQLADAEAKYNVAQRQSEKVQLDYQRRAEGLRQLRDDESKTIAQRISYNQQLSNVLKQQTGEELKIAKQAESIANLKIKLTGKSTENLNELAEAETKISDIRERIHGQESEQLENVNSLRRESLAVAKEKATKEKELKEKALNDSLISFETEKHTVEEQLLFYKKYYDELNKIQGNTEATKNAQELSAKILEISNETITKEIALQQKAIEEKKRISHEEKNELIKNAQFLFEAEKARIEKSLMNEKDKATAKLEIENGYRESLEAINATFKESEIARKEEEEALRVLEYENRLLTIEEQGYAESELRLRILKEEHEERLRLAQLDLDNGKITQEQLTQIKINEDKRYKLAKGVIDKEVAKTNKENQLRMLKDSIAVAQAIFGESKALSVATALINTYEGITAGVKLGFPLAIPAVALAAATGFKSVQNILKTDIGSGGASGGNTSSQSLPSNTNSTATASSFNNPARTTTIARADQQPSQLTNGVGQPILILESLKEAQNNQQIKIKSN